MTRLATYAAMIKKEEGELDFSQSADELVRKVRAFNPWPGVYLDWEGSRLKVHQGHVVPVSGLRPGTARRDRKKASNCRARWLVGA